MGNLNLCSPDMISYLEKQQNIIIENKVKPTLKKAYLSNTDIFGFANTINKKLPAEWKKLESEQEKYLPELDIEIMLKTKLREVGLITKPLNLMGE